MKSEIQESLMRRHLLGPLPEEEAVALEATLLADDEQFERACAIENKLVDDYARGTLSPAERESFERYYLASPVHRRRAEFAKTLTERADAPPAKSTPSAPPVSWRTRLSAKLSISPTLWQFALVAAVLVLATVGLWLFFDRARARRELTVLKTESEAAHERERALAGQIAAAQEQNEKLADELGQLRAGGNASVAPPTPAPRRSVFTFLLSPTLVRGSGESQTLTIPPETDAVRLQMKAEATNARRFQASVRTVEGRQVWGQQAIRPRIGDSKTAVVTASVPAGKLAAGDYILTLSSVNQAGETEELNRYFFRVVRR